MEQAAARAPTVTGCIHYVRNPVAPGAPPLTFVTERMGESSMVTEPGVAVQIRDMHASGASLDREGYALVPHRSRVADFHRIEEDPEVDAQYNAELVDLLKDLTGASHVVMQGGGKKRYGPANKDRLAGLVNALPALYPHGDTTDASARALAQLMAGFVPEVAFDRLRRWQHLNVWRPITPPPFDYPLALCDARTLSPDDRQVVVAHTETRSRDPFQFDTSGYVFNPAHRWGYFPRQTIDEALVFVTHDSDPARPHQVAHTAFADATCPPGAPTRGSVEARALLLYA